MTSLSQRLRKTLISPGVRSIDDIESFGGTVPFSDMPGIYYAESENQLPYIGFIKNPESVHQASCRNLSSQTHLDYPLDLLISRDFSSLSGVYNRQTDKYKVELKLQKNMVVYISIEDMKTGSSTTYEKKKKGDHLYDELVLRFKPQDQDEFVELNYTPQLFPGQNFLNEYLYFNYLPHKDPECDSYDFSAACYMYQSGGLTFLPKNRVETKVFEELVARLFFEENHAIDLDKYIRGNFVFDKKDAYIIAKHVTTPEVSQNLRHVFPDFYEQNSSRT
ncbi:hypothetical protein GF327_04060 [Candidatus Woesearchaeota archaeon]|nr:hypothetical protein [Candidatus Woesearchaeota archaeon]